jgi:hypothetical protein
MSYRVTGLFCVAGNPTKAWAGTTGEDDEEHVPDDVWEEQGWEFDELIEAKNYIKELHPQMTTHVALEAEVDGEWETILYMDSDADHIDAADVGVMMPSQAPAQPAPGENAVDESLTPYESQEG